MHLFQNLLAVILFRALINVRQKLFLRNEFIMNFLHIGYPKSASTFLQTRYFTKANGFFNLIEDPNWKIFFENQLLTAQSSYYFSAPPDIVVNEHEKSKIIGLSSENFLDSFSGVDLETTLQRWKNIFPKTKLLVIIRRQDHLVYSNYLQYLRSGYYKGVSTYLKELRWNSQQSIWGRLYYDRIYEIAQNNFDHIQVLPFELINTFDEFLTALNDFFESNVQGISPEPVRQSSTDLANNIVRAVNYVYRYGYGKSYLSVIPGSLVGSDKHKFNRIDELDPADYKLNRYRNKLIRKIQNNIKVDFKYRQHFIQEYSNIFLEQFSTSNKKLMEMTGLDLSKYKYPGL
ncbi:MAG: hypothetical protein CL768_05660 [Chloroflexi bacterium]|nr:hypothetical protein [Chloroflexota bacterium]|tara:strand:+ start:9749 stop:10783 length:1035 start_codon:yes stop_codon:yes gene_type:complete